MPTLRDWQQHDVNAVIALHATQRRLLGRGATGLGKAVMLAAIAAHYSQFGRVMVLVDVKKLVWQLADTIEWFTGLRPGVEMGDERSNAGPSMFAHANHSDQIVVSTVQTQYSGTEGKERYRQFDPSEFSALLLDECELFLAKSARSVVEWYLTHEPLRMFGCTATPFRGDGVSMANLFDAVAFNRDILWGMAEGWLVPAKQAFVRVSLDFSTLEIRKNDQGERDYSSAEIAAKLNNEAPLIELAKGILHVAGDRRSIVVCPDVASAKAVAHYLESERTGCAKCVYGELGDEEKDDIMDAHQRGEFQFLTSVMMLTKGYDDPQIRAVINCRKTKSKRLYTQVLGRGTRPLKGLLDGLATAEERKAAIAASAKPDMLMVNMVGVSERVRDITLTDILGKPKHLEQPDLIERAKELEEQGVDTEKALEQAEEEIEQAREAERMLAEADAERNDGEDEERALRAMVQVEAHIDVEYRDGLDAGHAHQQAPEQDSRAAGAMQVLKHNKVPPGEISRMTADQIGVLAREIIRRHKCGLCTYGQAKVLRRNGFTREQLHPMSKDRARELIDEIFANQRREREAA